MKLVGSIVVGFSITLSFVYMTDPGTVFGAFESGSERTTSETVVVGAEFDQRSRRVPARCPVTSFPHFIRPVKARQPRPS